VGVGNGVGFSTEVENRVEVGIGPAGGEVSVLQARTVRRRIEAGMIHTGFISLIVSRNESVAR
jgi:hypothetical protein